MNEFGKELKKYLEHFNISQKEFADRINTTPKNLIDIINGKIELTQNMIYNISFVTNIPVSYIVNVENNFKLNNNIDKFLNDNNLTIRKFINKFSYKELPSKYNLEYTNERNDYSIAKDILKYLRITNPESLYKKDNNIFYKSKNEKPELLALWLERCYRLLANQKIQKYDKKNIPKLVEYIKNQAKGNKFNKEEIIKVFNENGIYLVIEDDLSTSKIRGAFRVHNDKPAIYLTTKYKRCADIYFALLHELAHCKSDFNRAKNGSLISFNDNSEEDYEKKADKTAFNWMIEDNYYDEIKNKYNDIEKLNVVKSFYVYRLANDKIIEYSSQIYQKYNKIIKE